MKTKAIDFSQIFQAAQAGDLPAIQKMLQGKTPDEQISNHSTMAVGMAAREGHVDVIKFLLPWTEIDDPDSPVDPATKFDMALINASDQQQWPVITALAPRLMESTMAREWLIQPADHYSHPELKKAILASDLDAVHDVLVKAEAWQALDTLSKSVDEPRRLDWIARHPDHLPAKSASPLDRRDEFIPKPPVADTSVADFDAQRQRFAARRARPG